MLPQAKEIVDAQSAKMQGAVEYLEEDLKNYRVEGQGMQYLQSVQFTSGYSFICTAICSRKASSSSVRGLKWQKVWMLSTRGSMLVMPERAQSTLG